MTLDPSNWMAQVYDQIEGLKLTQLSVPGSHDSGMSELTHSRVGSVPENTQTQTLDIGGQLRNGVRFLDFRPALYDGGTYLSHFSNSDLIGWDGSTGQPWTSALEELASFVALPENSKELVIVMFSHFYAEILQDVTFQMRDMTSTEVEGLYNDIFTYLGDNLYTSTDGSIDLAQLTVGDIVGTGKNVICVFDTAPYGAASDPAAGIFTLGDAHTDGNLRIWNNYSDQDGFDAMQDIQNQQFADYVAMKKDDCYGNNVLFLLSWTLTWLGPGSDSIETMATQANTLLDETLGSQSWTALITPTDFPNIVYEDYIDQDRFKVVETCLSLMGIPAP